MNENRIAAMIEAGLSSSDQQAPLAALHVRLVLTDEAVSLDANTIDNFKTIILAAANNGDNTEQLLKVLNELSNQEHLARALFDQSFSLEMLSNVQSNSQPLVLKLIRKIYPDLKTLFNRSFNGAANLLAHLLSPKMDVGTRLSALKILEEYPELWELKGVYDNVLKQASFNSNKEPATAAKALEVLSAHRLQDTNVQKAVLDFCSRFKEAPAPSMTAIRLVENNFFDFELTSDLGASLQKAINDCYASSSGRSYAQTEKTTYSSQDANIVFALCRLYGLLLRARIIYPLWPNFSILLNEAIINLDLVRMPFFWVRNGRRAIKAMISSYRLALDANLDDQSQIYDNFIGALNAVSSAESKCINRPQLLAAFLGLNLFREPPFELHKAFQQYNRQISALLTGEIKSTADTNALQEFIQKARTKVKEIYNDLPKPGDSGNGDPFTSHPFPESGLSPLLQEYLRQPSHDTYQKILKIINTLFPSGDEKNWCDSFRQHSVAYLAERQVSQYELWLNIARDRFHNADNQARRSLDNATPLQLQAHARRFMGLPALVNSLMIVKPEPIVIRDFLRECKNKFEGTFQCPGAINIATPDAGLSVYFDQRRLESVLENCFSNALHSVEGFNKDVKTAEDGKEPRKPKVSISASRQGAATEIKVMDNGGGLPPLFLKDEESKGLGTAIILEYVVNSAGGSVQWADNNPDNNLEGANVILSFPDKEIFDE
jgi:hypothetical protein